MDTITLEIDQHIAVITLNRPDKLNSINGDMLKELRQALLKIRKPSNSVRCVVLTGEGRLFSAGADLTDASLSKKWRDLEYILRYEHHSTYQSLHQLNIPLISAIQGPAIGIGMSLAITADMIFAVRDSYFSLPFAELGLVVEGGASYHLPRLIGRSRAYQMSYLSEKLPVEKALEWGLVNDVFDSREALMSAVMAMAKKIADGADAMRFIKQAYRDSLENSYESQLELEARLSGENARLPGFGERMFQVVSKHQKSS